MVTPLAHWFAVSNRLDPFVIPTLSDLFLFAAAYAGEPVAHAGKSADRRLRAGRLGFDLELKRVPFTRPGSATVSQARRPASWNGESWRRWGQLAWPSVQPCAVSTTAPFDVSAGLEPQLTGAVLLAHAAPVAIAELVLRADAAIYCPSYDFVDEEQVRQAHAAGVRIQPWTVNEPEHWKRLIDWGVDGLTTDYPDRLAERLHAWGVAF